MLVIFKKELWSYIGNWTAWLIIAIFSIISSLFLFFFDNNYNIFEIGTATLQSYFVLSPWILMFIIPALSMKSLVEEQQNGILSWLFSQPVHISEIVCGKFFSIWFIGILCLLPSIIYFYTVYVLGIPEGNIDIGATLGSFIGLIFLIGAFSAIGILASALSSNQIAAYLFGGGICFFMYYGIGQLASYKLLGSADFILQNIGLYQNFLSFTRGLIDTGNVFYFVFIIMCCLLSATYFVEKKKS